MTEKKSEKVDPARQLELLWRRQIGPAARRRGPRPAVDLDQVLAAAVGVADVEGLAAVTVRRVTSELGIARMSVYTHVSTRDQLIELMVDQVLLEAIEDWSPWPEGWAESVEELARRNLTLHRRHPWLGDVSRERPALGPGVAGKYERELSVFDGLGLTDIEMDLCLSHVLTFVRGVAEDLAAAEHQAADSTLSNEEWWQAQAAKLATLMDPADYPLSSRVGSAAGAEQGAAYDAERSYAFGLSRVIAGLADLIARPSGTAGSDRTEPRELA